jgi:hypothetical protein
MFKSVIGKFGKYLDKMEAEKPAGFNDELWTEVNKRLQQLELLYNEIHRRHSKSMELIWKENRRVERLRKDLQIKSASLTLQKSRESRKIDRLMFQIEMSTESFYYFAGRMRTVLRSGSLPRLKSFECKRARNVRNKLLEHPEGRDSQVFVQSFGVGGEAGPTLKIERSDEQEAIFPDAGLWANAEEIRDRFERLLDKVWASKQQAKSTHC